MAAADAGGGRTGQKTIKRHMSALSGLFVWLEERAGEYRDKGPDHFQGHRYGRSETKQEMWDSEDLAALFRTPIWTGWYPSRRAKPGAAVIYDAYYWDAYYWLPLLATFHGLRQEENGRLRASDIQRLRERNHRELALPSVDI